MVRPLAHKQGQSPNRGRSPIESFQINGGAEPRLTSGGKAGVEKVKFRMGA